MNAIDDENRTASEAGSGDPLDKPRGHKEVSGSGVDGAKLKSHFSSVMPMVHWWLGEIGLLLPPSLRRLFSEQRLLVTISHEKLCFVDPNSPTGEEICHALESGSSTSGSLPPYLLKQRCDLLLDEALVLVRELELPLEAESTLRRVLSFSMDHYTPFAESDVVFDYRIVRRDLVNKKIAIILYVAPTEGVEPAIHALADMNIEIATVDVASASANGREGIDLCPPEWRSATAGMNRFDRVLALSALALLLVVAVMPFIQRQQATSQLESELSGLRAQLHQAESDREDLLDRIERMTLIQQQTSAMPSVLDVLLELTHLMSDESWAGQVTITSGRVRLSGEASAASELLAQLSKSSIFSDPRFEAPLTQNPKTGNERYVISLAIRGNSDTP